MMAMLDLIDDGGELDALSLVNGAMCVRKAG